MSEELISKKELLELMNISYGQLYRWKRKKLIPEEWFIKKAVTTGQETFFPKDKIIQRIDKIIELKENVSLDDLANQFTGKVNKDVKLKRDYLIENFGEGLVISFESFIAIEDFYKDKDVFALLLFKILIENGAFNVSEIQEIVKIANEDYEDLSLDKTYNLIIKRKFGVLYYYVIVDNIHLFSSKEGRELLNIDLTEVKNKVYEII